MKLEVKIKGPEERTGQDGVSYMNFLYEVHGKLRIEGLQGSFDIFETITEGDGPKFADLDSYQQGHVMDAKIGLGSPFYIRGESTQKWKFGEGSNLITQTVRNARDSSSITYESAKENPITNYAMGMLEQLARKAGFESTLG